MILFLIFIHIFLSTQKLSTAELIGPNLKPSNSTAMSEEEGIALSQKIFKKLAAAIKQGNLVLPEDVDQNEDEEILLGTGLALPQVTQLVESVLKGNLNLTTSLFHKTKIPILPPLKNPVRSFLNILNGLGRRRVSTGLPILKAPEPSPVTAGTYKPPFDKEWFQMQGTLLA